MPAHAGPDQNGKLDIELILSYTGSGATTRYTVLWSDGNVTDEPRNPEILDEYNAERRRIACAAQRSKNRRNPGRARKQRGLGNPRDNLKQWSAFEL